MKNKRIIKKINLKTIPIHRKIIKNLSKYKIYTDKKIDLSKLKKSG